MKQAHIYISFAAVLMAAACQTPQDRCAERQAPIVLKDGSVIHGDPIIAGDCVMPPMPVAAVPPGTPDSPPPPGGGGGGGGGNPPDVDTDPEQSAAAAEAGSGAAAAAEQGNEVSVASASNSYNGGRGASAGAQQGNEVSGRF